MKFLHRASKEYIPSRAINHKDHNPSMIYNDKNKLERYDEIKY